MRRRMALIAFGVLLFSCGLASAQTIAGNSYKSDTCWATGDVNGDGTSLSLSDLSALVAYVANGTLPAGPLWQSDLNGDDHVNQLDIDMFQCYLTQGMSCFPIYPVPTDCDPDTSSQANSIVIFDLLHTAQENATLDTTAGKLIVSNIGSSGNDGVTINLLDTLQLWEGVLENPDLSGSVPVGASLNYKIVAKDILSDSTAEQTLLQTKMASNQWQLGVSSATAAYTIEAWRDGWVVFHHDSVTAVDLGYIVEAAEGDDLMGFGRGKTNKALGQLNSMKTRTHGITCVFPDGVQWTWAVQGVTNLTIDELVVDAQPGDLLDTCDWELSSVSIMAKNIPSFTILHERKADIDTATVFGLYHQSEGVANIASIAGELYVAPRLDDLILDDCLPIPKNYAGVYNPGDGVYGNDSLLAWCETVANLNTPGNVGINAKLRVLSRATIDGKHSQPLMALFLGNMASNQWSLGVSSITSTYTVEAKRHNTVVFKGTNLAAADLGYIVETAKGINPTKLKKVTTGKPASIVSTGWDWGASPDGVQWTWPAHGVANLTVDELEVSWTTTSVVLLTDVSTTFKAIREITITDEVRSDAVTGGDANDDESVNVGDAVYVINYIFKGGPPPPSKGEGDANGDCKLNVGDAVYLINYIFKGGNPPIINYHCTW